MHFANQRYNFLLSMSSTLSAGARLQFQVQTAGVCNWLATATARCGSVDRDWYLSAEVRATHVECACRQQVRHSKLSSRFVRVKLSQWIVVITVNITMLAAHVPQRNNCENGRCEMWFSFFPPPQWLWSLTFWPQYCSTRYSWRGYPGTDPYSWP